MKITIIYDNDVWKTGLQARWGFSCLVEAFNLRILFDTGGNGSLLLENMRKLNIDPMTINSVFISHNHGDHTGGLADFLKINPVKVYLPPSCSVPPEAKEVMMADKPLKIHENMISTGELKKIEQSLVIKMDEGVAVIVGCSHPGVQSILEVASQFGKVRVLIGGLHGFRDFRLVKDLKLICPTHCTQYKARIKALYPEKYVDGGVGRVITI